MADDVEHALRSSVFGLALRWTTYRNIHQEQRNSLPQTKIPRFLKMQTPEPEISRGKTDPSLSDLEDHLDELWERYLTLLNQYTKAQDEIKKHLNSAFIALAKAQSRASLGRRYGQDWYDERMKASRKARVLNASVEDAEDSVSTHLQRLNISAIPRGPVVQITHSEEKKSKPESKEEDSKQQQQQPSPPGTPEPESKPNGDEEKKSDQAEESKPTNPLRWFGVLVPPELKRAQTAFSAALGDSFASEESDETCKSPFADAVNAARAMRDIEAELRKTRKAVRKAEKASTAGAH
jgi:hypothetical protein